MKYTNQTQETAIDDHWFSHVTAAYKLLGETYTALMPSPPALAEQRQRFEDSKYQRLPDLHPDRVDPAKVETVITRLQDIKAALHKDEADEYVKSAYTNAIEGLLGNARMVLAAYNKDYASFDKENIALYDGPKQDIFSAACAWIRDDAAKTYPGASDTVKKLADKALSYVPENGSDWATLVPSEAVFRSVRELHRQPGGYYDYLFGTDGPPKEAYIDQAYGDTICKQMLQNIGSDYAVKPAESNIWSTSRDMKQLLRPGGYRLDRDEFVGIVSHEIGSHIMEVANGSRQRLRLLGFGLAGFEKSSEGRAFLREQIVYPHESVFLKQFAWEYIVLLYLSVCLAQGLSGKKYTFAELYEVVHALYAFWRERRFPLATNNEEFAREEAWFLAVRIFKGTTGEGGSYLKDIVYLEGNIACWELAKSKPEMILHGDIGKFDIANDRHLELLRGLAVIPS